MLSNISLAHWKSISKWRHTDEDGFEMWETTEDPNKFAIIENDNKYDLYALQGEFDSPEEAKDASESVRTAQAEDLDYKEDPHPRPRQQAEPWADVAQPSMADGKPLIVPAIPAVRKRRGEPGGGGYPGSGWSIRPTNQSPDDLAAPDALGQVTGAADGLNDWWRTAIRLLEDKETTGHNIEVKVQNVGRERKIFVYHRPCDCGNKNQMAQVTPHHLPKKKEGNPAAVRDWINRLGIPREVFQTNDWLQLLGKPIKKKDQETEPEEVKVEETEDAIEHLQREHGWDTEGSEWSVDYLNDRDDAINTHASMYPRCNIKVGMAISKAGLARVIKQFGPYAYHGTDRDSVAPILTTGLKPWNRINKTRHRDRTYRPRKDHVYLHTGKCPGIKGGSTWSKGKDSWVRDHVHDYSRICAIRVDLRKLDPAKFDVDEDIFFDWDKLYDLPKGKSIGESVEEEQDNLDSFKNVEKSMMAKMFSYRGTIPTSALSINPEMFCDCFDGKRFDTNCTKCEGDGTHYDDALYLPKPQVEKWLRKAANIEKEAATRYFKDKDLDDWSETIGSFAYHDPALTALFWTAGVQDANPEHRKRIPAILRKGLISGTSMKQGWMGGRPNHSYLAVPNGRFGRFVEKFPLVFDLGHLDVESIHADEDALGFTNMTPDELEAENMMVPQLYPATPKLRFNSVGEYANHILKNTKAEVDQSLKYGSFSYNDDISPDAIKINPAWVRENQDTIKKWGKTNKFWDSGYKKFLFKGECFGCDGVGKTRCYDCEGNGNTKCEDCNGRPRKCWDCRGSKKCNECRGTGTTTWNGEKEECSTCYGDKSCTTCTNDSGDGKPTGKVCSDSLNNCYGTGRVDCPECFSGVRTCRICQGAKTLGVRRKAANFSIKHTANWASVRFAQDGGGGSGGGGAAGGGGASGGSGGASGGSGASGGASGGGDGSGGSTGDSGASGGEGTGDGSSTDSSGLGTTAPTEPTETKPSFGPDMNTTGGMHCPRCQEQCYSIGTNYYSCMFCGWAGYAYPRRKKKHKREVF